MANIKTHLNNIKGALYGKDVRNSIHDAIEKCYTDASINGNANMEVIQARGEYETLGKRLDDHVSKLAYKASKSDLDVERKRIDSFTKLEQGTTTGDAELIDARIGADGIIYDSLGASVRTQISNINENFKSNSLLRLGKLREGYVCQPGGYIASNSNYNYIYEVPVTANTQYQTYPQARFVCFYDADKKYISCEGSSNYDAPLIFTAPQDGYMTISIYKNAFGDFKLFLPGEDIKDVAPYGKLYLSDKVLIKDNGVTELINEYNKNVISSTSNLITYSECVEDRFFNSSKSTDSNPLYNYYKVKIKKGIEYKTNCRARFLVLMDNSLNVLNNSYLDEVFNPTTFTALEDGYAYITLYKTDLNYASLYEVGKENNLNPIGEYKLNNSIKVDINNIVNIKNQKSKVILNSISEQNNNLLINAEFVLNKFCNTYLDKIESSKYSYFVLPIKKGVEYNTNMRARFLVITDKSNKKQENSYADEVFEPTTFTALVDGYAYITIYNEDLDKFAVYETGVTENIGHPTKYCLSNNIAIKAESVIGLETSGNILAGKKWVACGDSFTAGGYSSNDGIDESIYKYQEGIYTGKQITYPYIIGLRNNMTIVNEAISGSCMGKPTTSNRTDYFSNTRYKNIPSDTDYITLYFGINDDNFNTTVGTIDDTDNTTFYGAWNVVMEYLITNHPYAKIGIIVTNGSAPRFTEAIRNIAKKWGIPTLDLEMDYNVPLMIRATERPELCDKVIQLRRDAFKVSQTNTHPNVKAHEYQSTFIENWLRSL